MLSFDDLKDWCESKGLKHRITKVHGDADLERKVVHFFEKQDVPIVVYTEISGNLQMYYIGYGHDHIEVPLEKVRTTSKLDSLYLKAQDFDFRTSRTKRIWDQEMQETNRRQIKS